MFCDGYSMVIYYYSVEHINVIYGCAINNELCIRFNVNNNNNNNFGSYSNNLLYQM